MQPSPNADDWSRTRPFVGPSYTSSLGSLRAMCSILHQLVFCLRGTLNQRRISAAGIIAYPPRPQRRKICTSNACFVTGTDLIRPGCNPLYASGRIKSRKTDRQLSKKLASPFSAPSEHRSLSAWFGWYETQSTHRAKGRNSLCSRSRSEAFPEHHPRPQRGLG